MEGPKLTIVVPVYNVEQYLPRCVDSILAQTFKDFELLLVDDGSTDGGGRICDDYAARDARITVVHKPNGGLSDARNAGIDRARGAYIGFVDSDDYIAPDMYECLIGMLEREGADIAMCGLYDCYGDKPPCRTERPDYTVMTAVQAIYMVLDSRKTSVTAVNKLYRRAIFDEGLRFAVGKITEDGWIMVDALARAERVVFSGEQKYYYVHRPASVSTARFSPRDMDTVAAYAYNYRRVCEIDRDYLEPPARMRCCWARFFVLDKMIAAAADNCPEREEIVRYLKENRRFILQNEVLTRSRKLVFLAMCVGYPLYRRIVQWQAARQDARLGA